MLKIDKLLIYKMSVARFLKDSSLFLLSLHPHLLNCKFRLCKKSFILV